MPADTRRGGRVLPAALAGVVMGFDNLGRSVALASLVFAGGLAAGAPVAVALFLASGIIGTGTLLLKRFFVGPAFSVVQNTTVAILLPAIFAIAALDLGITSSVVLGIGPEGGWSQRDLQALQASGFGGVRLGPRILRTETAGIAAIAALQARFGDFA